MVKKYSYENEQRRHDIIRKNIKEINKSLQYMKPVFDTGTVFNNVDITDIKQHVKYFEKDLQKASPDKLDINSSISFYQGGGS